MNVNYLCSRLGVLPTAISLGQEGEARTEARTPPLTVALSREEGTPVEEVAREVGARLGWPVYDHELLELIGEQLHVPVSDLEAIDERPWNWLLECIQGFSSGGVSEVVYVRRLVGVIRSLAARGSCVIVGRGAAHILPPESTMRVKLVGNAEDRIAALGERLHLSTREAARRVEQISQDRRRFVREHFHKDPTRLGAYDVILNTSQWPPRVCADLVEQALRHKLSLCGRNN